MPVFENDPRVLSLCLKMTPHMCLEMTIGFLGPKMMAVAVKIDSKVYNKQFLHQAPFTPGTLYARNLLHATPATPDNNFYTRHPLDQKLFAPNTFYTRHLLHQTPVTQDNLYHKQLSHQAPFTPEILCAKQLLHQTPSTTDNIYTRQLLHQTPFTPDSFYTKQLLHQTPFTPETCCTKQLLRISPSHQRCSAACKGMVHPTHDLVSLGRKKQCAKCFMKVFVDTKNHPKGLEKPCRYRPYRKQSALKAEDLRQKIVQGGIERFARKKIFSSL